MKLLVTGSSGFFGRNFVEQYEELHILSAPAEKQLNLLKEDSIKRYFSQDYFDVVLHLADKVRRKNGVLESDGLLMFRNIQRASILNRLYRVVYIGDGSEYGLPQLKNVSEDECGNSIPDDAYGVTKYLVNNLIKKDKISTNLRHFFVYGKYASPYDNIFSAMAYHAVMGKDIILKQDRLVSLIFIDDSLKIINAAVNGELEKGDYNVCATKPVKLSQVARALRAISGKQFEVRVESKKMLPEYTADNSKLLASLPKTKFTPLKRGLTSLYAWMEETASEFSERKIKID